MSKTTARRFLEEWSFSSHIKITQEKIIIETIAEHFSNPNRNYSSSFEGNSDTDTDMAKILTEVHRASAVLRRKILTEYELNH